jgi:hypothetical protein
MSKLKNVKKFNDLTKKDKDYIKSIYLQKDNGSWEKRAAKLGKEFGVTERTMRKWVSEKMKLKEKKQIESEQYEIAKIKIADKTKKRFIITWAQNNTPVHDKFFKNLITYSNFLDAGLHIIAGRYTNPTSIFSDADFDFWVDDVLPYLDANRHDIHRYLSVMSDIKIQPTAINPMSGMQSLSGINSCIFGSPKVQMEMIPVLQGNYPKMMLTTGAVTLMNYTDSKSGKRGEFHHTLGFVVVEIKDDKMFFMRQVTADDITGSFTDLFFKVENESVNTVNECEALIMGDLHFGQHDEAVFNKTFELTNLLRPKHIILHDVFDGTSINHHEMKNPFIQYSKEIKNQNSLQKEVNELIEGLKRFENFENVVIVRGNHDDFIDRWLANEDWRKQPTPKNSMAYMEYSSILLKQHTEVDEKIMGVLPEIIKKHYPSFKTLGLNDSYRVKNWELGQHGHIGRNGSKGTFIQFRNLNTKIVIGHSHTPQRKDGALSVGTTTKLRMGYNNGASSWLHSHVIIHKDGKAQHINFINSEYTSLKP